MSRENEIERIEVVGPLGKKHVREGRTIYSVWARGDIRLAEVPTPWGKIDSKGRKTCCYTRPEGYSSTFRCKKAGKLHTDDRYYCGTHNPAKVEAKGEARHAAWNAKWAHESKMRDLATKREAFRGAAADAILKIAAGHNDAAGLAREVAAMDPDR